MSRTVSIQVRCDQCDLEVDEADVIVTPVKFGKKEGVVDLCQPCVLDWENDLDNLFFAMRPVDEPIQYPCSKCDRIFNTMGARNIHLTRTHKKEGR